MGDSSALKMYGVWEAQMGTSEESGRESVENADEVGRFITLEIFVSLMVVSTIRRISPRPLSSN
jgi:hypothetical protein